MARVRDLVPDMLLAQRGALFPWVPVFLGIGIGLYFASKFEPSVMALGVLATSGALLMVWHLRCRSSVAPLICALAMVALGVALAARGRILWPVP